MSERLSATVGTGDKSKQADNLEECKLFDVSYRVHGISKPNGSIEAAERVVGATKQWCLECDTKKSSERDRATKVNFKLLWWMREKTWGELPSKGTQVTGSPETDGRISGDNISNKNQIDQ